MYDLLTDIDSMNENKGLLYLVFAIGGQCRVSSPLSLNYSQRYFTRGQQIAFEGMLEDPSIRLIHSFLLMAFYLLGACRRNAAHRTRARSRSLHGLLTTVHDFYVNITNCD